MNDWKLRDRIAVTGGEVAADTFGTTGSPVILVHGTPASSYLWRHVVRELAREHTVYVWDLLGYGDSRLGPGVAPSIALQSRTLAELVAHWDLDAPTLVGHDIGGGIVTRAHLVDGVAANSLALLDAAVIGPWDTPFTAHMQRHPEAYRTMPNDVFADIIVPRLRSATHRPLSEADMEAYLDPWKGAEGQRRWVDQVVAVDHSDTREAVARLGEVTVPTIVAWGEHDSWLRPEVGDRLAAAIPPATRVSIPDAGHFVAEDNPAEVARELEHLLRQ